MDILNKDELFTLSLHLDLVDFFNFCKTSRKHEKLNNGVVWRAKIRKDFPNFRHEDLLLELQQKSPHEIYILLYTGKVWKYGNVNSLYNVNYLYIEWNVVLLKRDIDIIPERLNLPKATSLSLSCNNIIRIPDNLNLPQLYNLCLSNNKITTIPDLYFPQIRNLILSSNLITNFPNLNFATLVTLHLADNNITSIPDNLNLPNLTILDLTRNKITTIPVNLNLPSLEILRLKDNPITNFYSRIKFPKSRFPRLINLEI